MASSSEPTPAPQDHDRGVATIVIPTRDRPEALVACLEAISRQTVAASLDVVVVDDGSRDEARVAEVARSHQRVQLIRIPASGPSVARNIGAEYAQGTLVLFTDDDCRPAPEWAQRLTDALRNGADVVAGSTVNGTSGSHLAEASQLVANALVVPLGPTSPLISFAPSNNLGCRVDVLRAVPFDTTFDRPGGEDRDWCARLARAGFSIRLEPLARVSHFQRLGLASFWRQQLRYGRGAYRFRHRGGLGAPLERPGFYARLLRQGARHGVRVGVFTAVAQLATALGFALEACTRALRRG